MDPDAADAAPKSDARQLLTFRIGDARLAMAAAEVAEVIRKPKITRVPHAPASLAGVTNLRGAVAPVVSLARLLGREPTTDGSGERSGRVILLDRTPPVGFLVDEVSALSDAGGEWRDGELKPGELFLADDGPRRNIDLNALLEREFAATGRAGGRRGAVGAARAEPVRSVAEIGLLAFELAGQAYALPLEHVREALSVPAGLAVLPDADEAALGVVTLRGTLLPLVSTRALLGLPARALQGDERVVVTSIGDSVIGLVVDRLHAILRASQDAIGPAPTVLNRGRGEARIESIYRSPDGRGLVSILKPERLFEDERVAQILADGRTRDAQGSHSSMTEAATERGEQFVVFRLGDEHYGLPVAAVDEIVRLPDSLTRVPNAPAFVEGVMNLRGKVVPVIDQRRRFQAPEAPGLKDRRRVIVTTFGALQAGFVVDRVTDILELTPDRMRETPELASEGDPVFDRVATAEADGQMILLVDPKALLDRAEADLLAAMAEVTPQS